MYVSGPSRYTLARNVEVTSRWNVAVSRAYRSCGSKVIRCAEGGRSLGTRLALGYEAAYERYQQLQCYKGRKNNVAILLKRLRSRDMA